MLAIHACIRYSGFCLVLLYGVGGGQKTSAMGLIHVELREVWEHGEVGMENQEFCLLQYSRPYEFSARIPP